MIPPTTAPRSWTGAAVWSAGFRPFFLAGAAYGPLAILVWLGAHLGLYDLPQDLSAGLWHSHELLVGYGAAVITGFVITGIPAWGECRALARGPLAALFFTWLAGRAAMWAPAALPGGVAAVVDLAFFPLLAALMLPSLAGSRYKGFYAILPILVGFFYANLLFHRGWAGGDAAAMRFGLHFFLYVIVVLYTIVGGLLAPIFTETELTAAGWRGRITFWRPLEVAAVVSVLAYAGTGLYGPPGPLAGTVALVTLGIHGWRMARWHGHRTAGHPLLWVMHLSYLWFLASVGLRAAGDFGGFAPEMASLHAFTIGAFGLMKIGFLTRVALRHTGRALTPHPAMVAGFMAMFAAAVTRLMAAWGVAVGPLMALSTILWALPFVIYLLLHGPMLIRESLPHDQD